jgi:L-fuculose-phosphate aldolase
MATPTIVPRAASNLKSVRIPGRTRGKSHETEQELRHKIVRVGRLMFEKGWVAANDGNITVRLDDDRILATPSGVSKGMMRPEDLIVCDMEGRKIRGNRGCTSEIGMHLTVYQMRPDVRAVVHAHPPYATGFAVAGRALDLAVLPEVILGLGSVPLAEYGLPGTPALSAGMLPFIPRYDAMLLANHGAVAYGGDVFQAFFRLDTVEHSARITLIAELLGGPKVLPRVEIQKLFDARGRYGLESRNRFEAGSPVSAEDLTDLRGANVAPSSTLRIKPSPARSSRES